MQESIRDFVIAAARRNALGGFGGGVGFALALERADHPC